VHVTACRRKEGCLVHASTQITFPVPVSQYLDRLPIVPLPMPPPGLLLPFWFSALLPRFVLLTACTHLGLRLPWRCWVAVPGLGLNLAVPGHEPLLTTILMLRLVCACPCNFRWHARNLAQPILPHGTCPYTWT